MTQTKPRLAEQALAVYDTDGEGAMLGFIMDNRLNTQDEEDDLWEQGIYILADWTTVTREASRKLYRFCSHNGVTNQWTLENTHHETRPVGAARSNYPSFPPPNRPLVTWPHTSSIQQAVLESIDSLVLYRLGMDSLHEPILNAHDADKNAPALAKAIASTLQDYDIPQSLLETLYKEQEFCADQVLTKMDPQQLEVLIQTAVDKIQAQDQT